MCTSHKESGPPMVAILQGLSANVQYKILNRYSLLFPLHENHTEITTEKQQSKKDPISIITEI